MQTRRRIQGRGHGSLSKLKHRRKRLGTKETYYKKKVLPFSRKGASKYKSRKMHQMNVNTNSPPNVKMVALKSAASNSVAASRSKRKTVKNADARERARRMQEEASRVAKSMIRNTQKAKKVMHARENENLASAMSKFGF